MILNIYTVFDSVAKRYGTPQFMASDGLAVRDFVTVVSQPGSMLAASPADFTLYRIGHYDDVECDLEAYIRPEKILTGLDAVAYARQRNDTTIGDGSPVQPGPEGEHSEEQL